MLDKYKEDKFPITFSPSEKSDMVASIKALLFATFCVSLSLQYTPFYQCPEGIPPVKIKYGDCSELPCKFYKNRFMLTKKNVATVYFNAASDLNDLVIKAEAKVLGSYQSIASREDNCLFIQNSKCPIKAGDLVEFTYEFSIPFYVPKQNGLLRVLFYNEKKQLQACFEMPGTIV